MKTRKTKNRAGLSWTPRRRGLIYCAPACGRGCTKAEHVAAFKEARKVLRRMKTRGWEIRVWENLGWHWCLWNTRCGLSLWPLHSNDARKQQFHCMMTDGDDVRQHTGAMQFHQNTYYTDPNTAVRKMADIAITWFHMQYRGWQNLNSIFTK